MNLWNRELFYVSHNCKGLRIGVDSVNRVRFYFSQSPGASSTLMSLEFIIKVWGVNETLWESNPRNYLSHRTYWARSARELTELGGGKISALCPETESAVLRAEWKIHALPLFALDFAQRATAFYINITIRVIRFYSDLSELRIYVNLGLKTKNCILKCIFPHVAWTGR